MFIRYISHLFTIVHNMELESSFKSFTRLISTCFYSDQQIQMFSVFDTHMVNTFKTFQGIIVTINNKCSPQYML